VPNELSSRIEETIPDFRHRRRWRNLLLVVISLVAGLAAGHRYGTPKMLAAWAAPSSPPPSQTVTRLSPEVTAAPSTVPAPSAPALGATRKRASQPAQ
jgi:hypothetical protein